MSNNIPLAAKLRPEELDDMVGQQHLIGVGKPLRNIIESQNIPNMIFYGYSGIGKTTLAYIIASKSKKILYKLNATTASTGDIKDIINDLDKIAGTNGVLLYLDEIQYFNKKQQQTLLEFIENGKITLIASTAENPYFYVYSAILSRSTVFEFKIVDKEDIKKAVIRAFDFQKNELNVDINIENGVIDYISASCGGDVRKAINAVEILTTVKVGQTVIDVTMENTKLIASKSNNRYDRDGDVHYDILSAFQKSIRGSDVNAALHYLGRLLASGDLISAIRRMLVTASEDIGLAYPMAVVIAKACADNAIQLGLPEASFPMSQAVIMLATAPKSNSTSAIHAAMADISIGGFGEIPLHLQDSHYAGAEKLGHGIGYQYPHAFENSYVEQQYLPDELKDRQYYEYGKNKNEQAAKKYWDEIKKK